MPHTTHPYMNPKQNTGFARCFASNLCMVGNCLRQFLKNSLVRVSLLMNKQWIFFKMDIQNQKSGECRCACFKDTDIFEKVASAAALVSRTPSSLKKRRVPLCLFQGHSRFEIVQGRHNYLQFAAIFAPSHGPICMKIQ